MLKGKDLLIYADGQVVAAAKSCRISMDRDTEEVSSPTAGRNKAFRAGRKEWSVSVSTLLTSVYGSILRQSQTVRLSFVVAGSASDRMTGTAIVQRVEVTAAMGRLALGSFIFKGSGKLEYQANVI